MTTLRQLERLWHGKEYARMSRLLLEMRPENSPRLVMQLARPLTVAAMAVIRLDELNQGHTPFFAQLIRTLLAAQEADGGWGDPIATAMALRALMCSGGQGLAIERGVQYLANLQKTDGLWPKEPLRRMPADPYVSAFILFQLADDARFSQNVRLDEAMMWFEAHENELDGDATLLWKSISLRHGASQARCGQPMTMWS